VRLRKSAVRPGAIHNFPKKLSEPLAPAPPRRPATRISPRPRQVCGGPTAAAGVIAARATGRCCSHTVLCAKVRTRVNPHTPATLTEPLNPPWKGSSFVTTHPHITVGPVDKQYCVPGSTMRRYCTSKPSHGGNGREQTIKRIQTALQRPFQSAIQPFIQPFVQVVLPIHRAWLVQPMGLVPALLCPLDLWNRTCACQMDVT
jgi:hypothetical protein